VQERLNKRRTMRRAAGADLRHPAGGRRCEGGIRSSCDVDSLFRRAAEIFAKATEPENRTIARSRRDRARRLYVERRLTIGEV
jgi:hypothetical protein